MVFKCQEDSFLKQFTTRILSVEYGTLDWKPANENEVKQLRGFNVVCEDTILFPEGGGQPCDYGTINKLPVRQVIRRGNEAVHFVEAQNSSDLQVDGPAKQSVDWSRRLDHMQQHTGQHLLSALFEREFNYNTTSWWLGTETSYVELDTKHLISPESLDVIENMANELIREGRNVTVKLVDPTIPLEGARAPRGLPKDHVGLARVICIEGIEENMCCGTHVTNLSQLQCVKLLYAEKTKNSVNVHFVIGQRVMNKLGDCFQREQQINLTLKGGPSQHLELIKKLQNNHKEAQKAFQKLLKEVAISEAEKVDNISPRSKYYCLHRKDGIEPDFIATFLRHAPDDIFYFLTVSDNTPSVGRGVKGHMLLQGEDELVKQFSEDFMIILNGKGNGREKCFQGKFNDSSGIAECDALLEKHFKPATRIKPKAEAS